MAPEKPIKLYRPPRSRDTATASSCSSRCSDCRSSDALLHGEWDPIAQLLEGKAQAEETAERLPYLSW